MFEFLKSKERYALALGSGGAKGFVHIGVIKALNELGIEITHIGGTSIGSLIGSMYALWGDIDRVQEVVLNYDVKTILDMFSGDIGFKNGFLKGDAFMKEIENIIGNATFEECKIPFVAVSVDVLDCEKVYHTSGLLKEAIRASCSIPLVFQPLEINGRLLVDGGIAESVPVEALKKIGARKVFGVNIQGAIVEREKKMNVGNLSNRIYKTSLYHVAKKDLMMADKKLSFNLESIPVKDLIENREEYIELGYSETMKLFS